MTSSDFEITGVRGSIEHKWGKVSDVKVSPSFVSGIVPSEAAEAEVLGIGKELHRLMRADALDASKFTDVVIYMFDGVIGLLRDRLK